MSGDLARRLARIANALDASDDAGPEDIRGAGQAGGSFVEFLHDAFLDTGDIELQLSYAQAQAIAEYIAKNYRVLLREDLK